MVIQDFLKRYLIIININPFSSHKAMSCIKKDFATFPFLVDIFNGQKKYEILSPIFG